MNRRMALTLGGAVAWSASSWTATGALGETRVADIMQRGKLRVALFPSFMYARKPGTGELSGVAVELARALGTRLGVEAVLTGYLSPPKVIDSLKAGECDVAFLGIDPARAADVDFTAPLMRADFTTIVPAGSSVVRLADADRPGVRIAVVRHHAMDIALRGKLKQAEAVYVDTPDAAFDLLLGNKVELSAGIRPGLLDYAARLPGSRVLDDSYGSNSIAIAVLKGNADRLAVVSEFARDAVTSGLAQRALATAGLRGVEVPR